MLNTMVKGEGGFGLMHPAMKKTGTSQGKRVWVYVEGLCKKEGCQLTPSPEHGSSFGGEGVEVLFGGKEYMHLQRELHHGP